MCQTMTFIKIEDSDKSNQIIIHYKQMFGREWNESRHRHKVVQLEVNSQLDDLSNERSHVNPPLHVVSWRLQFSSISTLFPDAL